jgi:hypothetical protein
MQRGLSRILLRSIRATPADLICCETKWGLIRMDWKSATTKDNGAVKIPERWLLLHYYEALNILFRMENSLRVFVYVVLKNKYKEKWAETALETIEEEQSTIAATASKRMMQAKGFGYLGYEISSPLLYLNSGELARLITSDAYWEIFKPFFRGKREIIKTKLDEISTVRNALAHFRPLKYDDIELIKQNVKHAFIGIEQCLSEMTQTHRVVPTNTEHEWYKTLSALGSEICPVKLYQNGTEKWVRVELEYASAILTESKGGTYRWFNVTRILSSAIINSFPKLAEWCTFMSESVSHAAIDEDNKPGFKKKVSLVFSKPALVAGHDKIAEQLTRLLKKIETETDLIEKDNLARGGLIDAVAIWASKKEAGDQTWWSASTDSLKCELGEIDPPEYWGEIGLYIDDFIAGSTKYPWMPSDISKPEDPWSV